MGDDHTELVLKAKSALDKVFSDRSVEVSVTRESLIEIKEEIDIMLDSMGD